MRKVFAGVLTAVMVLSIGTISVFAAGPRGRNYIDANDDGICDNAGTACAFIDEDGDGICDNAGTACAFVDEDGDGICDGCGSYHRYSMERNGCGRYYVDGDGDGVCDNRASRQTRGRGNGCRRGCGR